MAFIVAFIFCALIFITKMLRLNHTAKWFLICFQVIWGIVLLGSTYQPYGLYLPSDYTYTLLILNVVCFSCGIYITSYSREKRSDFTVETIEHQIRALAENRIYQIVIIIACGFSLFYFAKFMSAMALSSNLGEIRSQFYDQGLYGSSYGFVSGLFLTPVQIITFPVAAYCCLYRRSWIVIPMLLFLICNNSLSGGRFGYVKIFYSFLFIVLCIKSLNAKRLISLSVLGCIVFLGLSYVTSARSDLSGSVADKIESGIDETMRSISTYACGATVAFDKSLEQRYTEKIGGHAYGAITGASVVQVAYIISNKLGAPFNQPLERLTKYKQDRYINVGQGIRFNALYTAVLYFYLDFGLFGVIVLPLLFGCICGWLIKKLLRYRNIYFLIIVNFCFILSMFSITDFNFTTYTPLLVMFVLYYFGTRAKHKNRLSSR